MLQGLLYCRSSPVIRSVGILSLFFFYLKGAVIEFTKGDLSLDETKQIRSSSNERNRTVSQVSVSGCNIRKWLDGRVMCGNRTLIWEMWNYFFEFSRGFQHGKVNKFTVFVVECFQTRNIKVMLHLLVWLCLLQVFYICPCKMVRKCKCYII